MSPSRFLVGQVVPAIMVIALWRATLRTAVAIAPRPCSARRNIGARKPQTPFFASVS